MYMECKYCYCGTADKTQNNHYYKTFQLLHQFWTFSNQNLPIFGIEHFYFPCKIRKPLHNSVSTLVVCSANDIVSCYSFQSELRIFHHCRPHNLTTCLLSRHHTQYTYPPSVGEASWRRTDERHLPWIDWTASWFCWLSWVPDDGEWWCQSGQGCPSHLNTQTYISVYISTHFKCLAIVSSQYLR